MEPTWTSNPYYQEAIARMGRWVRDGRMSPDKLDEMKAVASSFADKEAASRIQYIADQAKRATQEQNLQLGQNQLNANIQNASLRNKLRGEELSSMKKGLPWNIGLGLTNAALKAKQGYDERQYNKALQDKMLGLYGLYGNNDTSRFRDMVR